MEQQQAFRAKPEPQTEQDFYEEDKFDVIQGESPQNQDVKACSPVSSTSIIGFSPPSTFSTGESAITVGEQPRLENRRYSPPLREKPLYANRRVFIKICLREIQHSLMRQGTGSSSPSSEQQLAVPSSSSASSAVLMATTAMPEFESIDAMDEECFTLEPFESLIQNTSRVGKEFILARVATADPGDSSKHYYSYYAAYQINKVLFRTQPSQGLLHRMKARNPLNNMPIVGDVYYFAVGPNEVQRAWENPQEGSPGAFSTSSSMLLSSNSGHQQASASEGKSSKIVYRAKFVGTDDNFLMISSFREYFKQNSMNADDFTLFTLYRSPQDEAGAGGMEGEPSSFRNLWGLLTSSHRHRNQPRWKVFTRRGLQVLMVVYIVVGFVLIKFVFRPNFAFLIGFILIMFFLFTLLFLVDCEA